MKANASKVNQEIKVNKINVDENEHDEDVEKECAQCKINQESSSFMEAMHERMVSELKKELFNMTFKRDEEEFESHEEACLAIDNMGEIIDERCVIETMKRCYAEGCIKGKDVAERMKKKMKSKEEEVEQTLKEKREEESEFDDFSSESDWGSSGEENEHEHGESLGKLFDG